MEKKDDLIIHFRSVCITRRSGSSGIVGLDGISLISNEMQHGIGRIFVQVTCFVVSHVKNESKKLSNNRLMSWIGHFTMGSQGSFPAIDESTRHGQIHPIAGGDGDFGYHRGTQGKRAAVPLK